MLLPAPRLIVLLAVWTGLGLLAGLWPVMRLPWLLAGACLLGTAAVDGWRGRHTARRLTVTRVLPLILPVGRRHAYHLRLHAPDALALTITDGLPVHVDEPPTTSRVRIAADRPTRLTLSVRPTQRGRFGGGSVTTRVRSPWRLCDWQASHAQPTGVRVFPDISGAAGGALESGDLRVPPAGARRAPRRGHGLEFKELRDYREGDALRLVDWKASARRGRPITREYEDQRDQQVLLALDCGHRMRTRDDTLAHFDHVLNAALRLAAAALAHGDAVGCATMADAQPRLLLPRKSRATLRRLVQGLFDVQPGHLVPDYLADARRLHDRLRRHSLIVLLTTLRDEDEEELLAATRLLRRRHRVTVASVRERVLDTLAHASISTEEEGARWASTLDYLQARTGVMRRLRQRGVDVIDVPPEQLSTALTAHYWDLKRAGTM